MLLERDSVLPPFPDDDEDGCDPNVDAEVGMTCAGSLKGLITFLAAADSHLISLEATDTVVVI